MKSLEDKIGLAKTVLECWAEICRLKSGLYNTWRFYINVNATLPRGDCYAKSYCEKRKGLCKTCKALVFHSCIAQVVEWGHSHEEENEKSKADNGEWSGPDWLVSSDWRVFIMIKSMIFLLNHVTI